MAIGDVLVVECEERWTGSGWLTACRRLVGAEEEEGGVIRKEGEGVRFVVRKPNVG